MIIVIRVTNYHNIWYVHAIYVKPSKNLCNSVNSDKTQLVSLGGWAQLANIDIEYFCQNILVLFSQTSITQPQFRNFFQDVNLSTFQWTLIVHF